MATYVNDLWLSRKGDGPWNLYRVVDTEAPNIVVVDRVVSCGRPVLEADLYTWTQEAFTGAGFTRIREGA